MKQLEILNNRINRLQKQVKGERNQIVRDALKARIAVLNDQVRMCKAIHKIIEPAQ